MYFCAIPQNQQNGRVLLYNAQNVSYNNLVSYHRDNKKPDPQRKILFAGSIDDILLADTYMIAAAVSFVK